MNRIYKLVWSKVRNTWVVASEIAKSHGKNPSASRERKVLKSAIITAIMGGVLATGGLASAALTADQQAVYDAVMAKLNEGGKIELGGTAGTNSGIAIGGLSEATKQGTVAIGERAKGEFQSVAIGQDAQARWIDDTPNVSGNNIAIGASTRAYAANGIAQGNYATVYGTQGIAIGLQATVGEKPLTEAEYKDKVAKGEISAEEQKSYLKTDEYGETVYRKLDTSGTNIKKDHFRGIAIGSLSQANAADSIALGSGAETYGENSAALGFCAQTRGDYSLAMGIQSKAEKSLSIAIGGLASAGEENSIAIGAKTRANKSGGVALGAGSIADRDAEKIGYALGGDNSTLEKALEAIGQKEKYDKLSGIVDPLQAEYNTLVNAYMNADSGSTEEAEAKQKLTAWEGGHTEFLAALKEKNNMSASWKSGSGAVSIGDAGNQKTRQLTGLAAGTEDTDAVNVAQLKVVNAKVDQNKTDITEINKKITNLGESSDWTLAVARGDDSKTEHEATAEGDSTKVSGGTVTLKAGRGVKLKQDGTNVQIGLKFIDMDPAGYPFNDAKASGGGSLAVGQNSVAEEHQATAVGFDTKSKQYGVALGAASEAGKSAVAIGNQALASGEGSIAIGLSKQKVEGYPDKGYRKVDSEDAIAIGTEAVIDNQSEQSTALGVRAEAVKSAGSAALGSFAKVENSDYSTAVGNGALVRNSQYGTALGNFAVVSGTEGGVALGSHSLATRKSGGVGYNLTNTPWRDLNDYLIMTGQIEAYTKADAALTAAKKELAADPDNYDLQAKVAKATADRNAIYNSWISTNGAVSIGNEATGITRQLTGVAAGTKDTDAVNVAQLKALDNKVTDQLKDAGGIHYFSVTPIDKAQTEDSNYFNGGAKGDGGIAIGESAMSQGRGIAMGQKAKADPKVDPTGNINAFDGIAIGHEADAEKTGSIALGVGATAKRSQKSIDEGYHELGGISIGTAALTAGDAAIALGANTKSYGRDSMSLGNEATSQESGVAVGAYSKAAEGGIAVGLEAHANDFLATSIGAISDAKGKYSTALGGATTAEAAGSTAVGFKTVSKGVLSTAVGAQSVAEESGSVALGAGSVANTKAGEIGYIATGSSATFEDALKTLNKKEDYDKWTAKVNESKAEYENLTKAFEDAPTKDKKAEAKAALDAWKGQHADFIEALTAKGKLEATWKATKAAVSVGADGIDAAGNKIIESRQITNVAAGTKDTDAVNVAQLKVVNTKVDQNKTDITNLKNISGKVIAGTNTTVTEGKDGETKTYAVNVAADGQIADGNTGIVTGDTVYKFVNPIRTQVTNMETTVNNLKGGFTIKDTANGTANVALGETTKPSITFKAETKDEDGAASALTAKVDGEKNVTYTLNTKKLKEEMGLTQGVGSMSSWKLKAKGDANSETIADGETVEFEVAEENKGLTVKRDGKKIQYGIDANKLVENINSATTKITNVDGDKIDISNNSSITNINKDITELKAGSSVHYFSVNSDDKNAPDGTNWNNDGATKRNAIAVGKNSKSTGESTVAVGTDSYAKNNYDLAMGYGANSLGYSGVAVGQRAIAGDSGAVSVGARTGSYGESGVAIGDSAANYGQYGVALGFSAKALDNSATVVGRTSKGVSGTTVLGRGNEIYSSNTVAIGGNSWVGNKEFIDDFHKYAYSHQGHDAVPRLNEYIKEKFLKDPAQKAAYEAKYADKLNALPGEPGKMNDAKEHYLAELILQEKASADMPASMTLLGSRTDGNVKDGVALGSFANAQRKEGVGGYDFLNNQEIKDLEKYLTSIGKMDEYNAAKEDFETKKSTFEEAEEKGIAAEKEAERLYQEYIHISTTQPEKQEEAKQNWEAAEEVRHMLLDEAYDLKKEALAAAAKLKGFGSTWVATHGAVAIGDEEKGFTRQITGLAAGTKDTDAVNVAQLKAVNTKVDQNKTDITNLKNISGKVINGTNTTVTEGTDIDGKTKTYAVNVAADGQIAENNTGIVTGDTVYKFVNPIKTQVTNIESTVNNLKGGFTIKDTATGTADITLGETTKPSITFKAETKDEDGAASALTAKVDGEKNVTYTLNTKKLKEEMGLTQGVGSMSSWKLKATGDTNSETIADGNEVEFAVAEENKGLTVKRAGKKIQYGIDANKLIDNINNATTKITNVDGEKIDISNNSSITNINKKITNLVGKATKVTVDGEENSTDGNLKIKKTEKDGQITYNLSLNDELTIGKDGKDGKIGINGKDGTSAEITVGKGEPGVDGKDGVTRIIYKDKDGKEHEVATLDDGLKFKGDNDTVVTRKLNQQLNITGGIKNAADLSDGNIGIVGTQDGGMKVKLSKNLKGLSSAEFKDGDNVTNITAGNVTITRKDGNVDLWELNNTVNNITQGTTDVSSWKLQANGANERIIKKDSVVNFKNGTNTEVTVNGNDVTVDLNADTKKQINDNTTNINNMKKDITDIQTTVNNIDTKIDQKIEGSKIKVDGDTDTGVKATAIKTGDKVTGYKISLDSKVKVGNVTIDGTGEGTDSKGEITGLTNTTLDGNDFAKKGRAATEEQLKAAMGKVQAQSRTTVKGSENITVTPKTESASEYTVELAKNINVDSVTAKTVKADEYKVGEKTYINDEGINANGNKITNVGKGEISEKSTDAVNGSQLYSVEQKVTKNITDLQTNIYDMGMKVGELDTRVNKVGAGAAALAALHPLDFDPDAKWDFAAGYGNYKGANAAAVGAYYRPNEDTMISVGGSFGGGENMVNAGIAVKLGQGNHVTNSKVAMAKEMLAMQERMAQMEAQMAKMQGFIGALTGMESANSAMFPDVPENHWAYEYVKGLCEQGVIEGYPDGMFSGNRNLTRYEMAAMLYRALAKGVQLDARAVKEFASELGRIRVDVISQDKEGQPVIERVRVNKK